MSDGGQNFSRERNVSWNLVLRNNNFIHLFYVVEMVTKFKVFIQNIKHIEMFLVRFFCYYFHRKLKLLPIHIFQSTNVKAISLLPI
jgi:hypothetical protein